MSEKHLDLLEELLKTPTTPPMLIEGKNIYFFDEVNDTSASMLISALERADKTPGEIYVNVFSGGGSIWAGFAIYDVMRQMNNKVVTIGHGLVGSAAVLPFLAGDQRLLNKNCRIFLHESALMLHGEHSLKSIKALHEDTISLENEYIDIIAKMTKNQVARIAEMCKENVYIPAMDAIKLGFAHGIILHKDDLKPKKKKKKTKKAKK